MAGSAHVLAPGHDIFLASVAIAVLSVVPTEEYEFAGSRIKERE